MGVINMYDQYCLDAYDPCPRIRIRLALSRLIPPSDKAWLYIFHMLMNYNPDDDMKTRFTKVAKICDASPNTVKVNVYNTLRAYNITFTDIVQEVKP